MIFFLYIYNLGEQKSTLVNATPDLEADGPEQPISSRLFWDNATKANELADEER